MFRCAPFPVAPHPPFALPTDPASRRAHAAMIESLLLALTTLQSPPVNPRDRDPFIFRSVLDQRPRIVTLALNKEMYLAYDAQTCGLYKCWKGGVDLKGAVYTTVHGDQPLSHGPAYALGLDGPVWFAEKHGQPLQVKTSWRGYFLKDGRAHLQYEVTLPDSTRISIQETPDYFSSEQLLTDDQLDELALVHGLPTLYRSFQIDAIPDDVLLYVRVRSEGAHLMRRELFPPGVIRNERILEDATVPASDKKTFVGELVFSKDSLRANLVSFHEPLPDAAPANESKPKTAPAKKDH